MPYIKHLDYLNTVLLTHSKAGIQSKTVYELWAPDKEKLDCVFGHLTNAFSWNLEWDHLKMPSATRRGAQQGKGN